MDFWTDVADDCVLRLFVRSIRIYGSMCVPIARGVALVALEPKPTCRRKPTRNSRSVPSRPRQTLEAKHDTCVVEVAVATNWNRDDEFRRFVFMAEQQRYSTALILPPTIRCLNSYFWNYFR